MERKQLEILVIEDDDVDVICLRRAFSKTQTDAVLHFASDGLEALEMLNGEGRKPLDILPTLILLDLNMPKMGGLEFLQAMRKEAGLKKIPVFVLTTSRQERDVQGAYMHNVAGYIVKPMSTAEFQGTLQTLIEYWDICEF